MTTKCYAMVRGSAVRITGLESHGGIPSPIRFAVSKSVTKVQINEVTESGSNELIKAEGEDNANRLHLIRSEQMIRYTTDIDFIRTDPGVLSLVAGVPLVYNGSTVVGFDSSTRLTAAAFALEVWSRLAGIACEDGTPQYGYTVLPFLKGGYLSGFTFRNGLVSFNLRGAQSRRVARWGVGPYDLGGPYERLVEPVSRNTLYKTTLTTAPPPTEVDGIQTTDDVIYGGTATVTTSDIIDGGTAGATSAPIIYGGQAV